MKTYKLVIQWIITSVFLPNLLFAQTNPMPFDLTMGDYIFTSWNNTEPSGTYPANMVFHRTSTIDPTLASVATSDYTLAYNLTTGTRINGLGANGFSFINTATDGNLGMAVLALNSLGRENITVSWTGGTVAPNSRIYAIRLQYRVGISGIWEDVPGPVEYVVNPTAGHSQNFGPTVLPSICNDQPIIQLRWFYYFISGTGSRPQLRVDDITVSSQPAGPCFAPTTQASGLIVQNIVGNSVNLAWTNGNGASRIVVARQGAPVVDFPQNGVNYLANAQFGTPGTALGSGFVVFNGAANHATVSGLISGQNYHFAVFEYGCNPAEYLVNNAPTTEVTMPNIPTLIVTPNALPPFTTTTGSFTLADSIWVQGSALTHDIEVTAPDQFQISLLPNSGFASSISIPQINGNVSPNYIYVRYFPTNVGNHSGNVEFASVGATSQIVTVSGSALQGASNPTTSFNLCSGTYSFDVWESAEPAGTYPPNMIFQRTNTIDPTPTSLAIEDYVDAYNLTSGTRINGLGANGIAFTNTATAGNLGIAVLSLNTTGRNNITVNWTGGMVAQVTGTSPREYRIRLQYRIGVGPWQNVPGALEYSSLGQVNGDEVNFGPIVLPEICNNQELIQLRWFYYQFAANNGGARPRLRLDNISVSSQAIPTSDVVSVANSGTDEISSLITGSIIDENDGVEIWKFTLRDGAGVGDSDNLPTTITSLSFVPGTAHTAGNLSNVIQSAALFLGSQKIADASISANAVSFSNIQNLEVADNAELTLSLRITLRNTGTLIDNSTIQLQLSASGITTLGGCVSSQMMDFTPITSDATLNVIQVEATQISFAQVPSTVLANQPFTVVVRATDTFGNIDFAPRQFSLALGIEGNGNLSSASGLTDMDANNGVYTWTDLVYNLVETFEIVASDNTLPQPYSVSALIDALEPCFAPDLPASQVVFSNINPNSLTVSWNNGNGESRLVVARIGNPVNTFPLDGVTYTANAAFGSANTALGSGFVVFNGSGNSVNVSNLSPATTYHFAIFEYNCDSEQYLTTTFATGNATTAASGLADLGNDANAFNIFPNPTSGDAFMTMFTTYRIYELTGRLIGEYGPSNVIQTQHLNAGVYIIAVPNSTPRKLIIEK